MARAKAVESETDWSDKIGKPCYECLVEMVEALETEDEKEQEAARERIEEDPLSVEVREGWHAPGAKGEVEEYCILLSTGGPATRIVGNLGQFNEPETARLEVQDWFKPWTEYREADQDVLLKYVRCFYFGD